MDKILFLLTIDSLAVESGGSWFALFSAFLLIYGFIVSVSWIVAMLTGKSKIMKVMSVGSFVIAVCMTAALSFLTVSPWASSSTAAMLKYFPGFAR
jgi:hypothetical protein